MQKRRDKRRREGRRERSEKRGREGNEKMQREGRMGETSQHEEGEGEGGWRRDGGREGEAERGDVFESGTLPLYVHL